MSIGFVIQARVGSTRLPGKMVKPFYKEKNILSILIEGIQSQYPNHLVILATTTNPLDDPIVSLAALHHIACYRGNEDNVLERFIGAAEQYNLDVMFRVCADNPFLDIQSFYQLEKMYNESTCDYIGFKVNQLPSIKTHFGFWGELVTVDALKKVVQLTSEKVYQEHVTNYIYSHAEHFKVNWIVVDPLIAERSDIRLTVDTLEDFQLAQKVYTAVRERNVKFNPATIILYMDQFPQLKESMKRQIERNSK